MEMSQAWRGGRLDGRHRHSNKGRAGWNRELLLEAVAVAGCLVALQVIVFREHYLGNYVPPWDFWSHYTSEAYAWWANGSFFNPPNWMPFLWGGYPAAASLQNSAWYLPVGIANAIRPFDLRLAAMVQAFHVAFGALGAYLLIRTAKLGRGPAFLALCAYYFAPAFFGNASHLDIARAFAWAPWVFLCAAPWWPWRRPWAFLVAVIVFWQTIIGAYPGVTVMLAYALLIWVIVLRLPHKRKLDRQTLKNDLWMHDLLPLAIAGLCAVLLSLVKFLPYFLVGASEPNIPIEHTWDLGIFGTMLFPFYYGFLSGDITHRSLFIVAPILPLALCANRRRLTLAATIMLVFYFFIAATNQPWWPIVSMLPAIGLSRFVTTDARVLLGTGLIILACVGLRNLLRGKRLSYPLLRLVLIAAIPLVGFVIGQVAGFPAEGTMLPLILLALSSLITAVTLYFTSVANTAKSQGSTNAIIPAKATIPTETIGSVDSVASRIHLAKPQRRVYRIALAGSLSVLALVSGVSWAFENSMAWNENRPFGESGRFGHPVLEMIRNSQDVSGFNRPARWALPDDGDFPWGMASMIQGNAAFYTGQLAVGGYLNITRTAAWQAIFPSVNGQSPGAFDARAFWAAPGRIFQLDQARTTPTVSETERCDHAFQCGENITTLTPLSFNINGSWEYQIATTADIVAGTNEAYYPGFTITAESRIDNQTLTLTPEMAPGGFLAFELPAGDWNLHINYQTPGMGLAWVLWWVGFAVALTYFAYTLRNWLRREPSGSGRPSLRPKVIEPYPGPWQ